MADGADTYAAADHGDGHARTEQGRDYARLFGNKHLRRLQK
jgi:hypothetical protein